MKILKKTLTLLIILIIVVAAIPFLHETLDYYPPISEKPGAALVGLLTGQRVSIETSLNLPVEHLPVYTGNSTQYLIAACFVNSNESYENCRDRLCFLEEKGELKEFPRIYENIRYRKLVNVTDDSSKIIDKIRRGDFYTSNPKSHPMSYLGRVKIIDSKIGYYNQTLYQFKEGTGFYVPVWVLHAETSNYGKETLLVEAFI